MRTLIAIAIGLMMLVSAAAATGVGNDICVEIESSAEDNCIVGVDLAQVTCAESCVFGCDNFIKSLSLN
jgi:uncharacterized membrane protein